MADTIKGEYYYGMGRRKTAVARVRLFPNGDGSVTVNGKSSQVYFGQREALTATAVAPFSLRARPGAPASTPLDWTDLTDELRPRDFNILTLPPLLSKRADPWSTFRDAPQTLTTEALRTMGLKT